MSARMLWDWLRADRTPPALAGAQLEFITRALPAWELERIEREYAEMRRETQRAAAEASMALERIKMDSAEDSDGDD